MLAIFRKIFKKKNRPENLKEMFDAGLLSKEEFLRFKIIQKQMALDVSKRELLNFLKKRKK